VKRAPARGRLSTLVGIVLLALMLSPVYWMVNASLQPAGNVLRAGWFPLHPDFSGYTTARDATSSPASSWPSAVWC
jgi:multiple sugar transport system permease protein